MGTPTPAPGPPSEPVEHEHVEHGVERLVFFTDAVVAIAITLLVLSLVDAAADATDDTATTTASFLHEHDAQIGAFLLSFVVISALWRSHHALFEHVRAYDAVILRTGFVWILAIVVLPLSTALLGSYGPERTTVAFYTANILVPVVCVLVQAVRVRRRPVLAEPADPVPARSVVRLAVTAALAAAATVLGTALPRVGTAALLILLLQHPATEVATRVLARRAGRRPDAPR